MKRIVLAVALTAIAPAALAEVVTFDPRFGDFAAIDNSDPFQPVFTWEEAGFQAEVRVDAIPPILSEVIDDFCCFIQDTPGANSETSTLSITFSRPDGQPFTPLSVDAATNSRWFAQLVHVPFDAQGNPDPSAQQSQQIFEVYKNLYLGATKPSGEEIYEVLSSFDLSTIDQAFYDPTPAANIAGELPFPSVFSDLSSLRIDMRGILDPDYYDNFSEPGGPVPGQTSSDNWDFFRQALALSEGVEPILPIFRELAEQCEASGQTPIGCTIPGLGLFGVDTEFVGNWGTAVDFTNFAFSVGEAPAPIPLPASALLLLGGIGALGVAARRRRGPPARA
ncbi:MAG: VPLPA-CTERM sorting domain-containing protein [Pseudomonadota bacterium]